MLVHRKNDAITEELHYGVLQREEALRAFVEELREAVEPYDGRGENPNVGVGVIQGGEVLVVGVENVFNVPE